MEGSYLRDSLAGQPLHPRKEGGVGGGAGQPDYLRDLDLCERTQGGAVRFTD